jgi:hypothetical protein
LTYGASNILLNKNSGQYKPRNLIFRKEWFFWWATILFGVLFYGVACFFASDICSDFLAKGLNNIYPEYSSQIEPLIYLSIAVILLFGIGFWSIVSELVWVSDNVSCKSLFLKHVCYMVCFFSSCVCIHVFSVVLMQVLYENAVFLFFILGLSIFSSFFLAMLYVFSLGVKSVGYYIFSREVNLNQEYIKNLFSLSLFVILFLILLLVNKENIYRIFFLSTIIIFFRYVIVKCSNIEVIPGYTFLRLDQSFFGWKRFWVIGVMYLGAIVYSAIEFFISSSLTPAGETFLESAGLGAIVSIFKHSAIFSFWGCMYACSAFYFRSTVKEKLERQKLFVR